MMPLSLEEADEIADNFHPIDDIVRDFNPELILDCDHQFESVEPVGPEIGEKVCLVRHKFEVDVEILGNETADPGGMIVVGEFSLPHGPAATHDATPNLPAPPPTPHPHPTL